MRTAVPEWVGWALLIDKNETRYMTKIKFDSKNYRKHGDENKRLIRKSLEECGAGRSVVIDSDGELIAGNGVYEQAQKLGMKVREVETDGSELVVVKRTDLRRDDEKRKLLAKADNATSDTSEWDVEALREDWSDDDLKAWGIDVPSDNGEDDDDEEVLFDAPVQLVPKKEYILIICDADDFDDARQHFGLGFVTQTNAGKNNAKPAKARTLDWKDYVNSDTFKGKTLQK